MCFSVSLSEKKQTERRGKCFHPGRVVSQNSTTDDHLFSTIDFFSLQNRNQGPVSVFSLAYLLIWHPWYKKTMWNWAFYDAVGGNVCARLIQRFTKQHQSAILEHNLTQQEIRRSKILHSSKSTATLRKLFSENPTHLTDTIGSASNLETAADPPWAFQLLAVFPACLIMCHQQGYNDSLDSQCETIHDFLTFGFLKNWDKLEMYLSCYFTDKQNKIQYFFSFLS